MYCVGRVPLGEGVERVVRPVVWSPNPVLPVTMDDVSPSV